MLFLAFTMKLSPARRVVYGVALLLALIGLFNLFRGVGIIEIAAAAVRHRRRRAGPAVPRRHAGRCSFAFVLMNLLVLLEVADRLSLKNDLEIARDIQQAMLPSGLLQRAGRRNVSA